jgi:hypothetical protein
MSPLPSSSYSIRFNPITWQPVPVICDSHPITGMDRTTSPLEYDADKEISAFRLERHKIISGSLVTEIDLGQNRPNRSPSPQRRRPAGCQLHRAPVRANQYGKQEHHHASSINQNQGESWQIIDRPSPASFMLVNTRQEHNLNHPYNHHCLLRRGMLDTKQVDANSSCNIAVTSKEDYYHHHRHHHLDSKKTTAWGFIRKDL